MNDINFKNIIKMRRTLTLFLTALLAFSIGWAGTVTFTAGTDVSSTTSITKSGITIDVTEGTFSRNDNYRCYSGESMEVTSAASVGHITKVEITCTASGTSNNGPGKFSLRNGSAGSYSYSDKVGTWTGDANTFTLDASGQVRMTSIVVTYSDGGSTTETVATPTFSPAEGTFTSAQNVTISCATSGATIHYTTDGSTPTTSSATYSSAIAVSETTTIKAIAVKSGMNNSSVASATYTIETPSTDEYELVTNVSQLVAGDKIIIVNTDTNGSGYALSTNQASGNRTGTSVSIVNSIIIPDNSVQILTLEKDGNNWLFNTGSGYLYASSSSSNQLKTETEPDANGNAEATISISSNAATITFQGTNTHNRMRYNPNNGNPIFACYTTTGTTGNLPYIYKKIEATPQANDVYIVGQINGHDSDPWVSTEGVQLTYNSTNDNYAANIYCTGMKNSEDNGWSYFLFAKSLPFDWNTTSNLYGSGADGSYWGIGGNGESAFGEEIPLYEGSKNVYRLPAGLYTVTVDLDYTGHQYTTKSMSVTKRDVTMTISPSSATFETTKNVTMASNLTELGGKIYYTTDGSDPRDQYSTRQEYTGQLTISATTTYKAVAVLGCIYSDVVEKTYTKAPAAPEITPASCTFNEPLTVSITAESGATIRYTLNGSNPTAESTQYTGPLTISETTTVKARAYVGEAYSSVAEATYTYSNVQPSTGDFELVTSSSQLVVGNEYIIASSDYYDDYVMGAISNTRGAEASGFTVNGSIGASGSTISLSDGSTANVLTLNGTSGAWTLKQSDNHYIIPAKSATDISTGSACNLVITIGNDYVANIQNSETIDSRQIRYSTSGYFRNYTTSQSGTEDVYLYTRVSNAVQKPVFSPIPGIYNVDIDVTISCATDGATIYYTTDGTDPTATTGTEYTGEMVVSESTTFKAIAVKDGNTSSVVTAAYTINKNTEIATVTLTYSEPFTAGIGDFTINNVSGFSPVWSLDGNYGVKGTSYSPNTDPTNNAAVSRLVSPIIDMTGSVQPSLTFSHQINKYFNDVTTQATVWIRETTNGTSGNWVQIPITFSDPVAAGGWTNDIAVIDLTDVNGVSYADKKVQISFLYTNPTEGSGAGTWEIQNFVVEDLSEYRMVNNIAEFLALDNGITAKFKNPVTVLYDYAQYSSSQYHEYIWVKDESGYMQFYMVPTLNSDENSGKSGKAAFYENGDIIPAGFIVTKNYYEYGKYVQAYTNDALNAEFAPATAKGLADPEHMEFSTLHALDASNNDDVATWCNRYITLEKIKITSKSGKNFSFANESGTVNNCVGYNKYNGDGSLLKDGTTSADVTVPAGNTYYNVTGIIQLWQGGWEFMPIEFTEWKAEEVTLRKLCADGIVTQTYKISNNLLGVYAQDNVLWVKDDTGQSIWKTALGNDEENYYINAKDNTREVQANYDQSNWLEIHFADGVIADNFVGKIINGMAIQGTFTDKANPTMTGVTLTQDDIYSPGSYAPNYYCVANFAERATGADHLSQTSTFNGYTYFFMEPKPQEFAMITWAMWDGEKFVVPKKSEDGQVNGHDFNGAFNADWSMNDGGKPTNMLSHSDNVYEFQAIIRKAVEGGSSSAPSRVNTNSPKEGQQANGNYVIYPLNLKDASGVITEVTEVKTTAEVESVTYYNIAGMQSDKPFDGINIVMTRYTDGTVSTSKVIK